MKRKKQSALKEFPSEIIQDDSTSEKILADYLHKFYEPMARI